MADAALRLLFRLDCPSATMRVWDGAGGPYVDADGEVWRPVVLNDGALDEIESAINGEAVTLSVAMSGVDPQVSDVLWEDYQAGEVIGSLLRIYVQELDEDEQPVGDPEVHFTGRLNNIVFDEAGSGDQIVETITIEFANRFALRALQNGAVLSDTDQRARSAILNPSANPDRICERVPGLSQRTIPWPSWG